MSDGVIIETKWKQRRQIHVQVSFHPGSVLKQQKLKHISMAVSWDGHESLILPAVQFLPITISMPEMWNEGCCGYMSDWNQPDI
jgi:hypothetical protein